MQDKMKSRYVRVGIFVVTALALLLVVLIALGAGAFLRKSVLIETYLDETVQGLDVGSPVKHRGVQIGNVEKIDSVHNVYDMDPTSPEYYKSGRYVYILIALDKGKFLDASDEKTMKRLLKSGLRIQLAIQGITGVAYLEADYFDLQRQSSLPIHWQPDNPYLPSVPSTITRVSNALEQVMNVVEEADLKKLGENLRRLSYSLSDAIEAKIKEISDNAVGLMQELRETNRQVQGIVGDPAMKGLVSDLAEGVGHAKQTFAELDNQLPPVLEDTAVAMKRIARATETLPETLLSVTRALRVLEQILGQNQGALDETFRNLQSTSGNLEETTSKLKEHPSRAIFGAPPRASSVYPPEKK